MKKRHTVSPPARRLRFVAIATFLISTLAMASYYFVFPNSVQGSPTELFFSEYIEGSSNNKALEIYNGTGAAIDLAAGGYNVQMFFNGSATAGTSINLTGTVANGDVFVLAQSLANATILAQADQQSSASWYNGDDAVVLRKGTTIIDAIGQIGFDPGTEWGSGLTSTADNTIRRKSSICAGDTNGSDAFDPSIEWDGFAVDTFTGLGSHTANCGGLPVLSIDDVTVSEGDSGTVTANFTVSLSSPAPFGGVTFDIATQDDSATTADNDYVAKNLTSQFIPFNSQNYSFQVTVNGDMNIESNERFFVNVTGIVGASNTSDQGVGNITNDDVTPPVFDVVISQVYGGGGNASAPLQNDFVELFNRGTTTVNLTGWSVQYASASGTTWQVTSLSGSIAPGGYYLVGEGAGSSCSGLPCGSPLPTPDATGTIPMSGTAGKVVLRTNSTQLTGSCPSGSTIVDLVGYGSANCFEGSGSTAATSNTTAALRKRSGCFDSNNNDVDFSVGAPNPRNTASPTNNCTPLALAIHTIQGSGAATPYSGQLVSTTGIVTARKSNGFFLQEPDASVDLNSATSEAIFVFTSSAPTVAVGNGVTVIGTATEFFNLTQLESTLPGDVSVNSTGNSLPAAVTLTTIILNPAGTPDQLERFEGMRMHADFLVSVAPTNEFGETFTVLQGVTRPMREPGIEISQPVPPDPTSGVPDCCIPRWDENPERIMIDSDGLVGSSVISVTSNVTLSNVTGPLDFTFSNYKVLPETPPATSANMSAVPVPVPTSSEFTVGGFNIENFNNNATQRHKAALAIRDVMHLPDVIGTIEIFELSGLQALAVEIESVSGVHYEAHLIEADGTSGDSDQDVGFLVKTSRVQIDSITQERATETYINPNTGNPETLHDRPPLVLRATVDASGVNPRPVIVIVNHLRSFIDIELIAGDGPRVRAKRKAQAESLAGLLQELQVSNPTTAIISVGDYNAYQFNDGYTDPIATLKGTPTADDQVVVDESPDLVNPNFTNLIDGLPADQRYSFIFEGTPQALDHVLLNTVAQSYFQRFAIARNNSDFPEVPGALFASDATRPERCSDHDMPVAYFTFPPPSANLAVTKGASSGTITTGSDVTYTITVTNNGPSPAQNVVVSDNLPSGVTFVSCSATSGGVCGGAGNNRSVTYSSLAAGNQVTVTLVATVNCAVANGTSISNTATVNSTTGDPDTNDNSYLATFTASNPPPSITCPANVVASNDSGQCAAVVNYVAPTTSDNCAGVAVVCSPTSGSTFAVGTTTVNCTATDSGGATASCSFTVTVNDTEAPVISGVSATPSTLLSVNHKLVDVTINYTATDNCGPVTCVLSVTSNEPENGTGDGDTAPDWIVVDAHNVKLRAERAGGGSDRIYTITITCTDSHGNVTTSSTTVTVPH